jgi:polygalacturonase
VKAEPDNVPYSAPHLNVYDETPGDVLIAGYDDAHRTEVWLDSVHIKGISPSQMHLAFADIHQQVCSKFNLPGPSLPLDHLPASVKMIPSPEGGCGGKPLPPPDPCAGKFVPMR